ncbi:MAG: tRNA (adenosine(37)-N6)-dimethylallyltransferase MiaA, partial [Bdellovibrionales bacterium]|nr:tRNA (adenosine(37)-N6)-dimethylallyltransferase MiaA [Bdellovibrionales bacterium]
IGSAKPSQDDRAICPHYIFDELDPDEPFTAGDFSRMAGECLLARESEGCPIAFVVGGSGFYLRALTKGMMDWPKADPLVRTKVLEDLKCLGIRKLYNELVERDIEHSKKIHPNDEYRILRALEILRSQPKTMTEIQNSFEPKRFKYDHIYIGFQKPREILRERVRDRTQNMILAGWEIEVRNLMERGWTETQAMNSVGYFEMKEFIAHRLTDRELPEKIVNSTMQLAKRQTTWFKYQMPVEWHDADKSLNEAMKKVTGLLNK